MYRYPNAMHTDGQVRRPLEEFEIEDRANMTRGGDGRLGILFFRVLSQFAFKIHQTKAEMVTRGKDQYLAAGVPFFI